MTTPATAPKPIWGFRIGRILQVLGLVIGLEGLLVYGSEVREGPMIYATVLAVAVFYIGWFLARRYSPVPTKRK